MNTLEYNKKIFPHWCSIPIRYRDLDPLNHVNNAIFSTFYEEARVRFIQQIPAFIHGIENGFSFVLAHIGIDFIKPVEYPATLLIGSGIKGIGKTSISSFQVIYLADTKEPVSSAETSGVWLDLDKQVPAPVPEIEEMQKLTIKLNHSHKNT